MYMRLLNRMYILYLIVNCNYIHLILDLGVRLYIYIHIICMYFTITKQ